VKFLDLERNPRISSRIPRFGVKFLNLERNPVPVIVEFQGLREISRS